MKNSWILPAVTLALGGAVGFISGNNINSSNEKAAVENANRKTRVSDRSETSNSERSKKRASRPEGTEAIGRLPGITNRMQALMNYYAGLSPAQLAEEARKLEDLPLSERMMASFMLFGQWAEVDATAAMAFSSTMGFTGNFVRPTILQSWASVDPAGAAKYLTDNPREFAMMGMMGGGRGPMGGTGPSSIIASEWAKQDPAAAMAWANTLTTDKTQAMNSVISEVAKTDPKKATEMYASMSGDKTEAARSIAAKYGEKNFTEAQAWIRTLPADAQGAAMASAISGLSNVDPNAAAQQVAMMQAGDDKDRAVSNVVKDLAAVNPKAAADFLAKQGSNGSMSDGLRELIPAWVNQDPSAALTYTNSLEAGKTRDDALQSWVISNNKGAPADTVKVAETISDQGDRDRAVGMAAARWMQEDPTAAKAYVQQSTTISDDAKQRIIDGRSWWGGGRRGGN